jgi:putative selenate reductase FAD-binding subunit
MITDIVRPVTVAEAVRAKSAPGAAYLGGGTWLNSGKSGDVTTLVSLEKLGLGFITADGGRCSIGVGVTFQALVDNPGVPSVLRQAALLTASRTLRNMVTVGGELGLRPVDSAMIPVLIALGAEVSLAGKKKPLSVEAFLRDGDEKKPGLILSVSIPAGSASAVRAISRTSHSPRSLVAVVSARAITPSLEQPRLVLSDCRGHLVRLVTAERSLDGAPLPPRQDIEALARAEFSPSADMHASVPYKRYMAGVLVADLLASLRDGNAS